MRWFQSLKRDVAFFHGSQSPPCNTGTGFQSLKRDVAFFHLATSFTCSWLPTSFNRSSAMWPSSTVVKRRADQMKQVRFQSLKRDVAFFHRP